MFSYCRKSVENENLEDKNEVSNLEIYDELPTINFENEKPGIQIKVKIKGIYCYKKIGDDKGSYSFTKKSYLKNVREVEQFYKFKHNVYKLFYDLNEEKLTELKDYLGKNHYRDFILKSLIIFNSMGKIKILTRNNMILEYQKLLIPILSHDLIKND